LDAQVKALRAKGADIVNLGVGEPDFSTPVNIGEAGVRSILAGFTKYTASEGILELREAVAKKLRTDSGLEYEAGQVVISNGAKHSLCNAMMCLFGEGDEVIIPTPTWVSYPELVMVAGARPVYVKTKEEDGYILKPEALERALTPRTRGIIVNSPSNPTGVVYSREDLKALAKVIRATDLWVVSDDIYEQLVYEGTKFWNIPMVESDMVDRTVVIGGVSKTYSMTGWRIGWLAGPANVAKAVAKLQSQMTSNPCGVSQKAALEAITGPQDAARGMVTVFGQRRRLILDLLGEIKGIKCQEPKGAFYVFPDVSAHFGRTLGGVEIKGSDDLASVLLKECLLATVPGSGFKEDRAIRLSYAASEEDIRRGLEKMARFLG
jgi:aspartate aminotransferase